MNEQADKGILKPGDVLNNTYVIAELVASGGTGEVYRATNRVSGREIAVKILKEEFANNEQFTDLLKREASVLHEVIDPSVVRYYDLLESDLHGHFLFIVMEYIHGRSLADNMRRAGPLGADVLLKVAHRILQGLRAAHLKNAFHRDLSPDNIILRDDDPVQATLIDFGIAKDVNEGAKTVVGDGFAGKYQYAAPEQMEGNADARSDLYSLGMTLIGAYRGQSPSAGSSLMEIVRAKAEKPDISDMDGPLAALVSRLTEPDPSDRFASAEEAIAFLDSGAEPEAEPTVPVPEPDLDRTVIMPRTIPPAPQVQEQPQTTPPLAPAPKRESTIEKLRQESEPKPKGKAGLWAVVALVALGAAGTGAWYGGVFDQPQPLEPAGTSALTSGAIAPDDTDQPPTEQQPEPETFGIDETTPPPESPPQDETQSGSGMIGVDESGSDSESIGIDETQPDAGTTGAQQNTAPDVPQPQAQPEPQAPILPEATPRPISPPKQKDNSLSVMAPDNRPEKLALMQPRKTVESAPDAALQVPVPPPAPVPTVTTPYVLEISQPVAQGPVHISGNLESLENLGAMRTILMDQLNVPEVTTDIQQAKGMPMTGWGERIVAIALGFKQAENWSIKAADNVITLQAEVENQTARTRLLATARQATKGADMQIVDRIRIKPRPVALSSIQTLLAPLQNCGVLQLNGGNNGSIKTGETLTVTGYLSQKQDRPPINTALKKNHPDLKTNLRLEALNPETCAVLQVLPGQVSDVINIQYQQGDTGVLADNNGFAKGDNPVIDIDLPSHIKGYLTVLYVDQAGRIIHLLPHPLRPDNKVSNLGKVSDGKRVVRVAYPAAQASAVKLGFTAGDPFGANALVSILSKEPLFTPPRPRVENTPDMLPTLQARLQQLDRSTTQIATRALFVRP